MLVLNAVGNFKSSNNCGCSGDSMVSDYKGREFISQQNLLLYPMFSNNQLEILAMLSAKVESSSSESGNYKLHF